MFRDIKPNHVQITSGLSNRNCSKTLIIVDVIKEREWERKQTKSPTGEVNKDTNIKHDFNVEWTQPATVDKN